MIFNDITFSDIFPELTDWQNIYNLIEMDITNYTEQLNSLYTKLYRKYRHEIIGYDTVSPFIDNLVIIIDDIGEFYFKIFEYYDKIIKLTDNEINLINSSLSNYAENPQLLNIDVNKNLDFITNQNYTINKLEKNTALKQHYKDLEKGKYMDFINEFGKLFTRVYPNYNINFERK